MWMAFVKLLRLGYPGLAIYTCFPLFCKYQERIMELTIGWTSPEILSRHMDLDSCRQLSIRENKNSWNFYQCDSVVVYALLLEYLYYNQSFVAVYNLTNCFTEYAWASVHVFCYVTY